MCSSLSELALQRSVDLLLAEVPTPCLDLVDFEMGPPGPEAEVEDVLQVVAAALLLLLAVYRLDGWQHSQLAAPLVELSIALLLSP